MKNYYLFLNNAADGPWAEDDIQEKLVRGEINGDTLLGEEGGTDWVPASQVFPDVITRDAGVAGPAVPPPLPSLASRTNPYAPPLPGYESQEVPGGSGLDFPLVVDGKVIPGTEGLTAAQIVEMVKQGGRFMVWRYNFSIMVLSFKRSSGLRFIKPGESGFLGCFGHSCISSFFGWWGFPWGLIWTPVCLFRNMAGGQDLTEPVLASVVGPGAADRMVRARPSTFHWHTILAGGLPLIFPLLLFSMIAAGASASRRSTSSSSARSSTYPTRSSSSGPSHPAVKPHAVP
jgi:hypothetical protein